MVYFSGLSTRPRNAKNVVTGTIDADQMLPHSDIFTGLLNSGMIQYMSN